MRQLTLEEEVQQRCEEKSPSEATEDPGPGGLHVDPMDSKTLQELITFFDNQIRVCCEYADNSECEDEFEFWREERFTMRAYRNYIRWCVL